ncbi:uncharacterized protein [Nerophis lumbriciformis]|uniref:uncharacterized protein isoform X1 n=1 Tax=Nerophis lumbriciformis TaxID=546530 RepID=UPI002AE062DC|nr:replication initiator 1 isoform X1 [Nerophis lumbriciformis]
MKSLVAFHSQLAAIMEALTRAAVAEISELVEESYTVLQMEISRSSQENEALRRKLDLIETIVAPEHGGGGVAVLGPGSPQDPVGEAGYLTNVCVTSSRVAKSPSLERRSRRGLSSAPTAEDQTREKDVVVIKQEVASDTTCQLLVDEDGATMQPSPADLQGGPSGMFAPPSADLKPWEQNSDTNPVEPHNFVSVPGSPAIAGSVRDISNVFDLASGSDEKASVAARRFPAGGPAAGELNQAVSLHGDTTELDLCGPWGNQGLSSMLAVCHRRHSEPDRRSMALEKMSDMTTTFPLALGLAAHRLEAVDQNHLCRDRRFVCNYCGKRFTSSRSLETHERVHTGERPYSCGQCGKRFTQSGHLKTHQSVHTGERPFACQYCDKRFAGKQNLRIHLHKHHPAEPEQPNSLQQEG